MQIIGYTHDANIVQTQTSTSQPQKEQLFEEIFYL